jgi:hypothetical protein
LVAAERLLEQARVEKREAIERRLQERRRELAVEAEASARTGRIAQRWIDDRRHKLDRAEVRSTTISPSPRCEARAATTEPQTQRSPPRKIAAARTPAPDAAYSAKIKEAAIAKSVADRRRRQLSQRIDAPHSPAVAAEVAPRPPKKVHHVEPLARDSDGTDCRLSEVEALRRELLRRKGALANAGRPRHHVS